jgi:hypothetical protein
MADNINNALRNNGITGGVFSFSLNDLFNNPDNTNNNANNDRNNNNPPPISFTSLGDTIINAINSNRNETNPQENGGNNLPSIPGTDIAGIISNIVNSFNNISTGNIHQRRATQEALNSLKPLKLSEIPQIEENEQCPICYDPYVEYSPDGQNENIINDHNDHNDLNIPKIEELNNTPFDGYDFMDPSIMFPAIETATYINTYNLQSEPEFSNITEKEESATNNKSEDDIHYAVQLPQCNHIFGRPCIVEWLQSNISCPLCRREIVTEQTEQTNPNDLFSELNNTISGINSTTNNNNSTANHTNQERTYYYDTAITETYVPIDWTAPPSMGCLPLDPPLSMPVPGIGMSSGRRTGRDP